MTKQEKIREGLGNLSQMDSEGCDYELCKHFKDNCRKCRATAAVEYLHSEGVVIKVEGELPKVETYCQLAKVECIPKLTIQQTMLKAGYTLTKPLVEE